MAVAKSSNSPRGRKRSAKAPAPTPEPLQSSDDEDLLKLHAELMTQIAERKQAQGRLNAALQEPLTSPSAYTIAPPKPKTRPSSPPNELSFPPAPQAQQQHTPPQRQQASPAMTNADDAPSASAPPPPPDRNPNAMNVIMVGAECAPWSKTGGLVRLHFFSSSSFV
jgi:hypothetical protein